MKIEGVLVPLITPFKDGQVDLKSYKRMIDHYIEEGVTGIMPLATTGECPTILPNEYDEVLTKTLEYCNNRVPIYVGLGGNNTSEVVSKLKVVESIKLMVYYL